MNIFRHRRIWSSALFFLMAVTFFGCHKNDAGASPGKDVTGNGRMLGPAIHYSAKNIRVGKTLAGDLNGDRRADVVTVGSGGSSSAILVYYQNSSGGLNPPIEKMAPSIRGFAIGDVNGDGRNDLVVSCISDSARSGYPGRLYIFYQDSDGNLLPPVQETLFTNTPGDLAIGDLNSDGRNDIVALGEWTVDPSMGNLFVFHQNADGALAPDFIYDHSPVLFTGEIRIADMNNDGKNDIVFQSGMLQLAILRQLPNGALDSVPDYYTVHTGYWNTFYAFAVGDINGDARNDVVVLDPGTNGMMNLFHQNTSGRLDPPVFDTVQITPPFGVEIADIDKDGLNDIVGDVVDPGYPASVGSINVFYQSAAHTFSSSTAYTFPTISGGGSAEHQSLAIGDVTGDGYSDAIVTWADEGLWILPSIPQK